jgi:N-acetylglucosaminyldiphosphoundecaprenol N-acetyl-beta-D-mannosaminyltransferase
MIVPSAGAARTRILGMPVDSLTLEEAVAAVARMIAQGGTHRVSVVNANKLWLMRRNAELRHAVESSDLVVPEWAIVWAGACLGHALAGHVAGITLLQRLLDEGPRRAWSFFFLGARPSVVETMVERLTSRYAGLRVVGWQHGYFRPDEEPAVLDRMRAANPDVLAVALGSPRQELWLARHAKAVGARVALGVGGTFDVLSGHKPDAPAWARGRGLEWLHRLWLDPRNLWKRYLITNTWFVGQVALEWGRLRLGRSTSERPATGRSS